MKGNYDRGSQENFLKWIEEGCEYFGLETFRVCRGGVETFGEEVLDVLAKVSVLQRTNPFQLLTGKKVFSDILKVFSDILKRFSAIFSAAHVTVQWSGAFATNV